MQQDKSKFDDEFNVVVVGDTKTGKTTLLVRFMFQKCKRSMLITISRFKRKTHRGSRVWMQDCNNKR